jgi:hypothetical protein
VNWIGIIMTRHYEIGKSYDGEWHERLRRTLENEDKSK